MNTVGFTLHELACFLAVAELGSFQKAAVRLHRSHPSVFAAVASLERQLGLALLDRGGYRVASLHLHEYGGEFLPTSSSKDILFAQRVAKQKGYALQNRVAHTVSPSVVNGLKPVDVDYQEREWPLETDRSIQLLLRQVDEVTTIAYAGQVIRLCLYFDPLLQLAFQLEFLLYQEQIERCLLRLVQGLPGPRVDQQREKHPDRQSVQHQDFQWPQTEAWG